MPAMTRRSFLLSTSKVKRKLPVQPNVPRMTSPSFSVDSLSSERMNMGGVNMLARAPSLVSRTFLPKLSGVVLMVAS